MIIALQYADFKKVCDEFEKRIYYYQEDSIVNLYFISEGILVYTFVDLKAVENPEAFFSQRMFVGAMKLMFKIPVHDESSTLKSLPVISVVEAAITEEAKAQVTDIQREGAEGGSNDVASGE
jgi:hypothetical protein